MNRKNLFDVIVIGSGPSGIFTSIKLIENGVNVALIDEGGNYYNRAKSKKNDLKGFGGAAMRYDANLDYLNNIPETSNLGERVFGDNKIATKYIKEVYNQMRKFGLRGQETGYKSRKEDFSNGSLEIIDRGGILSIGEKESTLMLKNIYDYLLVKGITFFDYTKVINIVKKDLFEITTVNLQTNTKEILIAPCAVLATGKLSIINARKLFEELGVQYSSCNAIDIGVRIEVKKSSTDQATSGCINPKIIFNKKGISTRTFCWCSGGRVIDYDFNGLKIIDGQHCHDDPTNQTNFGIVTTLKLPKWVDGTKLGISYIKTINEFTGYKSGLQILRDFIKGNTSIDKDIKRNEIIPTLSNYSLVDLSSLMIFDLKKKILSMIDKINSIYPNLVTDDALIYSPVLERIFPQVKLDFNMESTIKGFYVIGDISGKAIGIITGAAMGIRAASHIISYIKNHEQR